MTKNPESIPKWLMNSLQGLTFWVGYKRSLYRDYPLSEGALVTELRSLMHANLPDDLFLKCEVGYRLLAKKFVRHDLIAGRHRADLVVANKVASSKDPNRLLYSPKFVFEVKRASSPNLQIDKDLKRLAALKKCRPIARTFLIVLSEAGRNNRFVNEKGLTRRGQHKIDGMDANYHIRRTVKAASVYKSFDSVNYATVVEVCLNE